MKAPRNATHSIELLEARIAPASLTASVSGGILKIAALDSASAVTADIIQLGPDSFRVIDDGETPVVFTGVKGINATLSSVGDNLDLIFVGTAAAEIFRGSVSVSGAGGTDNITIGGNGVIAKGLTVSNEGGGVFLGGGTTVRGAVKITNPGGGVFLDGTVGSLALTGAGFFETVLGSFVAGDVKITAPDGSVTYSIFGDIGGSLSAKGGLTNANLTLDSQIDGNISLNFSKGIANIETLVDFSVGGGFTFTGGEFNDTLDIETTAPLFGYTFGGPVKLKLGNGNNTVTIEDPAAFASSLTITGGTGDDTVNALNGGFIHGAFKLSLGDGANTVNTANLRISGGLKYSGGIGADEIDIAQGNIFGSAKLSLGDGANVLTFLALTINNGLTIAGGSGNDEVDFAFLTVHGATKANLSDGENSLDVLNLSELRGGLAYTGGADFDRVLVVDSAILSGSLSIAPGNGDNLTNLTSLGNLTSLTYKGGTGSDYVAIENVGGNYVNGKVSLGDGSDNAIFNNLNFVSFLIDGGDLPDTLTRDPLAETYGLVIKNIETVS